MKLLSSLILLVCFSSVFAQTTARPEFNSFKTKIYKGKIHYPKWAKRANSGEWRDEAGKTFDENPTINFAGKYFIAIHSCGTGCSYYTLTDLSNGKDLKELNIFANGEELPKTPDDFEYTTMLYYRQDSNLIIAQFILEKNGEEKGCRERSFVLENEKLHPIDKGKMFPLTKNFVKCRKSLPEPIWH